MPATTNDKRHPLTRGGSSRSQRELASLSPAAASLDPRTEMELLDFVFQLSKSVVYHHEDLRKSDWQDFFRWSLPVQLALIARYDAAGAEAVFAEALQQFESGLDKCNLQPLFDELMSLARTVNRWHVTLPADAPLRSEIQSLISEDLRFAFQKLLDLAAEAQRAGLGVAKFQQLQAFTANAAWQLSPYALFVSLPVSTCGNAGSSTTLRGSEQRRKQTVAERLKELHLLFLAGLKRIAKSAAGHFSARLQAPGDLPPHVGLLLAFLRLYRLAQDDLNLLGERHLYYYFRTVLGLKEKDAVPDKAHLVIELDKNVSAHKLPAGFQFQDAKDANKADIFFKLLDEAIFSQAAVENLRTLYRKSKPGAAPATLAWESLHVAPVANTQDSQGEKFEDPAAASWKTLGFHEAKKPGVAHDFARVGFLIASPTLLLDEGNGKVIVKFSLKNTKAIPPATAPTPADGTALNGLFDIFYSGKKKWVEVLPENPPTTDGQPRYTFSTSTSNVGDPQGVFTLAIPSDQPIAFADPKVLDNENYGSTNPHLKFVLKPGQLDNYKSLLDNGTVVTGIELEVTANKIRKLILQNQEGVLDGNKPFLPFGSVPFIGSEFLVGSDEAFRKKLDKTELHITWAKLPPTSFSLHYGTYAEGVTDSNYFEFEAELLKNGAFSQLTEKDGSLAVNNDLFNNPLDDQKIIVFDVPTELAGTALTEPLLPFTPDTKNGFIKIKLTPHDFLHSRYPSVLAEKMLAVQLQNIASGKTKDSLTAAIDVQKGITYTECDNRMAAVTATITTQIADPGTDCTVKLNAVQTTVTQQINAPDSECFGRLNAVQDRVNLLFNPDIPNEPYTPLISDFFLSYTASCTWAENAPGDIQFLHLHPFEVTNYETPVFQPVNSVNQVALLPAFPNEGTLFIGVKNLVPGSNLSLLFQLAEATADPDLPKPTVLWHYLKNNEWKPLLPLTHVQDDTNDLLQSGIVKLSVPFDISNAGTTILPPHLHWLKASLPEGSAAVSEAVEVLAQGIQVVFDPTPENDLERLAEPLEPNKITKLPVNDAALKKVGQPFQTFGGMPREVSTRFFGRVSERLRHKGRAITLHDYERMTLEAFPQIFKVKCITHTKAGTAGLPDTYHAPGHVTLAVIPDILRFPAAQKLRPKASSALLCDIEEYFAQRTSCFVKVKVVNPIFQQVKVAGKVVLHVGKDKAFYQNQLQKDVLAFLTPWAFGEQDTLSFGGRLFRSSVLHFVERLEYVDFLTDFGLFDEADLLLENNLSVVEALTERHVLAAGDLSGLEVIEAPAPAINAPLPDPAKLGRLVIGVDLAAPGQPDPWQECSPLEPCPPKPGENDP